MGSMRQRGGGIKAPLMLVAERGRPQPAARCATAAAQRACGPPTARAVPPYHPWRAGRLRTTTRRHAPPRVSRSAVPFWMAARQASSEPPAMHEKATPGPLAPATALVHCATSAALAASGMHHRTGVAFCGGGGRVWVGGEVGGRVQRCVVGGGRHRLPPLKRELAHAAPPPGVGG